MVREVGAVLSWLTPRERRRWYLLAPLVGLAAVVEAAGALAVFGLLRLVVDPALVPRTPVVADVARVWARGDVRPTVTLLIVLVAAFYVLRALFLLWVDALRHRVVFHTGASAGERLFARYLAADYLFHARRRSAALIESTTRAADLAAELVAGSAVNILAEAVTIAALVAVLVASAPLPTLGAVAAVLAVALVPIVLARRAWTGIGETERALQQRQLHLLQQSLGAIKDVIITGRQAFFEAELRRIRRALAGAKERRSLMAAAARLGVEAVLILCMLLVVLAFTRQEGSTSEAISVLALFAYTGFRAVPSANRIMLNVGYLREGEAWARAIDADMAALAPPAPRHFVPEPEMPFTSTLSCEHATVAFEQGAPPALQDVSFAIRRGESIGIVGPTGAGKSTLVDVLLGLVRPSSGCVRVDGVSIQGRERAWQRRIGYVPQVVYLLDDSLRRNIAFGVPDATIDEARVWRAVSLARLDAVVNALPGRLDTIVGERGVRLSGGQRQRVAIARALYHDPDLLVFDEATAALDSQTERELTAALAELHGQRTLIAVAHRISTVQACDRLIFLQGGRLAGIGPYQDLLANPAFRALI